MARFADTKQKIISVEEAKEMARSHRQTGDSVGLTNGCFDILHSGHLSYLERARSMCDILIVGVNDDESVRLLKGPSRPINPAMERARLVAGLELCLGCGHLQRSNRRQANRADRAHPLFQGKRLQSPQPARTRYRAKTRCDSSLPGSRGRPVYHRHHRTNPLGIDANQSELTPAQLTSSSGPVCQ